ncbi:MAG: GspH/FimT family pseudopilin [Gemmatimonadetes bacterium]|nr:GspH/FimT family pseudopilin [Gemmatimonadota bacterium]
MLNRPTSIPAGVTLPELLITLTILGTLAAMGAGRLRSLREATSMRAATWAVRNHLALARSLAIARREKIRVRRGPGGDLVILTATGERVMNIGVGPASEVPVDSLRIRPATLRFNARGYAAPGSVYLYRGDRVVRIVSNFLGRLRVERHRVP